MTGAGDTGAADERLAAAVCAAAARPGPAALAEVHAALVTARVFAAVTATATGPEASTPIDASTRTDALGNGVAAASAEMALIFLVATSGARALPVFLDVAAATGLRPGARPVPRTGQEMARAALDDGAQALLLDPAGVALVIGGTDLPELAAGRVPVAGTTLSTRRTEQSLRPPEQVEDGLLELLAAALVGEPVSGARLLEGPDGPVLGVVTAEPMDAAALAELAARVLPRLGAHRLDLAAVAAAGPGRTVPLTQTSRRWRWSRRAGEPPAPRALPRASRAGGGEGPRA